MKLNTDCLRDSLLKVEELQRFYTNAAGAVTKDTLDYQQVADELPAYETAEVFYALLNLEQAGFIDMTVKWTNGFVYFCCINDVTYEGHQFADKVRDDARWGKLKGGLSVVRDYSLSAIEAIAEGITTAAITAYLTK